MNSIVVDGYAEAVVPLIWQFSAQTSLTFATTIEFMTKFFFDKATRKDFYQFSKENKPSNIATKATHVYVKI